MFPCSDVLLAALNARFELIRKLEFIFEEVFDPLTELLDVVRGSVRIACSISCTSLLMR